MVVGLDVWRAHFKDFADRYVSNLKQDGQDFWHRAQVSRPIVERLVYGSKLPKRRKTNIARRV